MKVIAVVGAKKTGKTTLVERMVRSLKGLGKVGTVKDMMGHQVDSGDTRRHFMAGADEVIGLGDAMLKVTHDGSLQSALKDLYADGMDFVVVEGFKMSDLPKVVLGDVQVARALKRVDLSQVNDDLIREIVNLVLGLEDFVPYNQDCSDKIS